MPPISRPAFARSLRRLDADAFAAFVADLWRARGRDATVEDGPVIAVDGADPRRLLVHHRRRWLGGAPSIPPDRPVDAVVTNARRPPDLDVPVIDADELREVALYGVDRDAADEVFERYFGRPVSTPGDAGGWIAADRSLPGPDGSGRAAAGVLGALVLGIGLLLGPAGVAPSPGGVGATVTPAATSNASSFETPGTVSRTPTPLPGNGSFPPGLDRGGIADADALAEAHVDALENRSYRLRLVHREFVGDRPTAVRVREFDVDGSRVVVSERFDIGNSTAYTPLIPDSPGETIQRPGDESGTVPSTAREELASTASTAIRWYLSVDVADIKGSFERNGTTFYWVIASGDPWPGVENATTSALVDSRGIVHELRRVHDVAGTNVTVVFTLQYTGVGGPPITSATASDAARDGFPDAREPDAPAENASSQ